MSIQAVGWALDQDLPARPKLVLVAIANHANHTDGYCWLKAETIAAEAACTPRSVYRFIGGLVRNGFVRKTKARGADGKQRANDYWILFDRVPKDWDWGAGLGDDDEEVDDPAPDSDAETHGSEDEPTQDVAGQSDGISPGDEPLQTDSGDTRQDENARALSCGPGDSRVSHKQIAEPSKTNLKSGGLGSSRPRRYQPPPTPPPQPVGATTGNGSAAPIFVYEATRAYEAWAAVMARKNGLSRWSLTTTKVVDGHVRRGWYFPTLFPPSAENSTQDDDDATGRRRTA